MCGITGFVSLNSCDEMIISKMTNTLAREIQEDQTIKVIGQKNREEYHLVIPDFQY